MMRERASELEKILSNERADRLFQSFDINDYYQLSQTGHSMFQFLKRPLLLAKLAYYLVQVPSEIKINFIINDNLELLKTVFDKVVLPSCTVMDVTPLQLAYGAGDVEMCDVLQPFFVKLYGSAEAGMAEMQKQIGEMQIVHQPFDFSEILQAISKETFSLGQDNATGKWRLNETTLTAIKKFIKDYDSHQPKTIKKGMQFRWETLEELNAACDKARKKWQNKPHYYLKCGLIEDVVFSWVFHYATENDKQRFNQGIYFLQKINPEPFNRMQKTRDGFSFDEALKKPSVEFVLESSWVDILVGERARLSQSSNMQVKMTWSDAIKEFCQNKKLSLQALRAYEESIPLLTQRPG